MKNYELSILVLTYNQERYISQTIDSIIEQILNIANVELIIADDCSDDNTKKIVQSYGEKYSFIKPIYNERNKGLLENYYNAISFCSGEYIMGCGGDDYWLPGKIKTELELMRSQTDIGACCSGIVYVDKDNRVLTSKISKKETVTYDELLLQNVICASSVCFRRKLWIKYYETIRPFEKNWRMEDYPFWLWLSKNAKISIINEPLCVYRILDGSVSHSSNLNKRIEFENNTYEIVQYFSNLNHQQAIRKRHLSNITNIYFQYDDLDGFRRSALLEKSIRGYGKCILSFFPGYFKLRKHRKKIGSCLY